MPGSQGSTEMSANDTQVGGGHYKTGGEEHWDRAYRLRYDCFQYIITKWIERWRKKGGLEDLRKARHAIDKYIEVVERESAPLAPLPEACVYCGNEHTPGQPGSALSRYNIGYICSDCGLREALHGEMPLPPEGEPGPGYVNQG